MTTQQINTHLDEMLSNPKTKNFLNHLITAYYPESNVSNVWEKPEGIFKCVLTKQNLVSVQEIREGMQTEEFKTEFMENLKSVLNEKIDMASPVIKLIGEKKMGVTGKNTTTFMCHPALQEFTTWIVAKLLANDKHITWLLGGQNNKPKQAKPEENNTTSIFTLGELDSFKKLYEKFK